MSKIRAHRTALGCLLAFGLTSRSAVAGIGDLQGTKPGDLPNGGYFASAEQCFGCHRAVGSMPKDYMPFDTWAGTMMANSWRDPVFSAALVVANQDKAGVGTFCLRCHAPIGFVRGHATPPDGSAFDPPADVMAYGILDGQGVGCDVCHRANTVADTTSPAYPYYLSDAQLIYNDDINKTKHGPYEAATSANHATVEDPKLADSRFCGQCHQVTNPELKLRDASGALTTLDFPLDTTYEEWASSDYAKQESPDAKSCMDCHMRKKVGQWPVQKVGDPLRTDPPDHAFVGGNHWGIQAVMKAFPDRATTYATAFEVALGRTLESLTAAATVTLTNPPLQAKPGAPLEITVRVENLAGHKFPTGFADTRRAWIAVALVDASGAERTLLGGYDAATGEIQAEPPTHVYRAVHGRWNGTQGEKEVHLALHDMLLSDTRIPPKGFVASQTTTPTKEIDFSDGKGGYRNYDEVTFKLTAPADVSGVQRLSARVYYQSMTKEYVDFLSSANTTNSKGTDLAALYEATEKAPPMLVGKAESKIDFGAPATGSGGSDAGAGGATFTPTKVAPKDDGGCGCRTAGGDAGSAAAAVVTALALASAGARRRRSGWRR